jgi:hypothetical protein
MPYARGLLSRTYNKDDLRGEFSHPWDACTALLFDDDGFVPLTNNTLYHGITATDFAGIYLTRREHVRNARTLADQWTQAR